MIPSAHCGGERTLIEFRQAFVAAASLLERR
jgi:hypothetical protein